MNLIRIMILPLLLAVHGLTLGGIDRGNTAYNQGDYGSALQEWRPLAEQGNAGAQLNPGFMYDNGDGAALPSAVLVDANGTMIGDAQTNVSADFARVYFGVKEKYYYAQLEDEWFYGFYLYYDGPGCTGNAYVRKPQVESSIEPLEALREGIFYTTDSDEPQTVTIVSVWEELDGKTDCDYLTTSPPIDVYPAVPLINTNVYTKPYQLKLILAK